MRGRQLLAAVVSLAVCAPVSRAEDEDEAKGGPPQFRHLSFRLIGPGIGGRCCRACGVPGDPHTYYAAAAAGGVWKSTDGGVSFRPIFDDQPVASVGSIAVAPSDPNVIYVGTGEANIRGNVASGNGIYRSTDAGKTWKHVWKQEGQIGTMIVHPSNPDVAFAAVFGKAFAPNPQRGVYRTTDGGKTWKRVLHKDSDTGASDVCFDPHNPRILFAGLWQARRRPWEMTSGGPGGGLYVSRDGGDHWRRLTGNGLPDGILGKIGVAVAPSDGRRVYALIEAEKGGLFRSDDGGDHWRLADGGHYLRQRAWYYSTLTVDPVNPDVVWCPQVPMLRSIDGGKTFHKVKGLHHGDNHDAWVDPKDPRRVIVANDGGIDITADGRTWQAPALPIAQFYHVAADNRTPYHVSGPIQDWGTAQGPSNSLSGGAIAETEWHPVGGGETGFTAPDPSDPDVVYAGEYGGIITRYDNRTRQAHNVSIYPTNPSGHGAEDLRYRFQWTAPIMVSPHDSKTVYHAANVLFQTTDGGQHWARISDDLTRNDRAKQKWSGGPITGDNTGVEYYGTIFAIAESPKQKGLLWAGSDDGLVHVRREPGGRWENVTANIPGIPEWGTVNCIEVSPSNAGTAYVVVDAHRLDDSRPYLYKTTDFGRTWRSLTANMPADFYLHVVREDPRRPGLLYVGSERGVEYSADGGATWTQLKLNLPTVPVHDLVVKEDDLVVGTHGRSIWIFDQVSSVRDMSSKVAEADVFLFPARPAVRYRYHGSYRDKGVGKNPPPGVVLDYYLKAKQKGDVVLEILDGRGEVIATLDSKPDPDPVPDDDPDTPEHPRKKTVLKKEAGVNRVVWDMRYQDPALIKGAKIDTGEISGGPMVTPGTYTVRLKAAGKVVEARVEVRPDRRVRATSAELDEQMKMALTVRDDITHLTGMVNQLRAVRRQLARRNELLKEDSRAAGLVKAAAEVTAKLDALEAKIHNPKAEVVYDILAQQGGTKLYSNLIALYEWIQDSDAAPTQGMREVYAEQAEEMRQYESELRSLLSAEVGRVNQMAEQAGLGNVVVPQEKGEKK